MEFSHEKVESCGRIVILAFVVLNFSLAAEKVQNQGFLRFEGEHAMPSRAERTPQLKFTTQKAEAKKLHRNPYSP